MAAAAAPAQAAAAAAQADTGVGHAAPAPDAPKPTAAQAPVVSPLRAVLDAQAAHRRRRQAELDDARKAAVGALVGVENVGRQAVTQGLVKVLENQRALEAGSKGLHGDATALFQRAAAWNAQQAQLMKASEGLVGVHSWASGVEGDIAALITSMEEVARRLETGT